MLPRQLAALVDDSTDAGSVVAHIDLPVENGFLVTIEKETDEFWIRIIDQFKAQFIARNIGFVAFHTFSAIVGWLALDRANVGESGNVPFIFKLMTDSSYLFTLGNCDPRRFESDYNIDDLGTYALSKIKHSNPGEYLNFR